MRFLGPNTSYLGEHFLHIHYHTKQSSAVQESELYRYSRGHMARGHLLLLPQAGSQRNAGRAQKNLSHPIDPIPLAPCGS